MGNTYLTLAPALYFGAVGLKFGPARDALEAAASELGLADVSAQARLQQKTDARASIMDSSVHL